MSLHHTDGPSCPLCEEKVLTAHPYMQGWFKLVKERYPDCHVSWAYRNKKDQDRAFSEGKSNRKFPLSPHNYRIKGEPASLALDLFQINDDNQALFNPKFYARVAEWSNAQDHKIRWGGHFKTIGDACHFEFTAT